MDVFTCRCYVKKFYRNYFPFLPFKDKCAEREEEVILTSSANEIAVGTCNLNSEDDIGPVTWYEKDGETPVCRNETCRINQQKENIWFVPAKVGDSGPYYCSVR